MIDVRIIPPYLTKIFQNSRHPAISENFLKETHYIWKYPLDRFFTRNTMVASIAFSKQQLKSYKLSKKHIIQNFCCFTTT